MQVFKENLANEVTILLEELWHLLNMFLTGEKVWEQGSDSKFGGLDTGSDGIYLRPKEICNTLADSIITRDHS